MLDDYHLGTSGAPRQQAFLLERLPHRVHVVISTRVDPDSRCPAGERGELVEIRAADLRFTATRLRRTSTTSRVWVSPRKSRCWSNARRGGSLRYNSRPSRCEGHEDVRGFISRFAGNDRYIVDYLVEEVLATPTC